MEKTSRRRKSVKLEKLKPLSKGSVTYEEIKDQIIHKLKETHGSVSKFAYSDEGMKVCLDIGIKPEYIKMYLTPKGAKNFKMMQHLFSSLGLGNLDKKVEVVRTTTYFKV